MRCRLDWTRLCQVDLRNASYIGPKGKNVGAMQCGVWGPKAFRLLFIASICVDHRNTP
jgi:hypothetical protein